MWKPGQLVTIDHKVYRVTKNGSIMPRPGCWACRYDIRSPWLYPCSKCLQRIPLFCHLKLVKPKNHV